MSTPYIGQIDMFGGNFAPKNYAMCNGQLLSISQNQALFSILGTAYGGNGVTTFALPNLQSALPVHMGAGPGLSRYAIGQTGGVTSVTLNITNIPQHNHILNATDVNGDTNAIGPSVIIATAAGDSSPLFYANPEEGQPPPVLVQMALNACGFSGQSQSHTNLMPSLCITFIIALQGVFPSRN